METLCTWQPSAKFSSSICLNVWKCSGPEQICAMQNWINRRLKKSPNAQILMICSPNPHYLLVMKTCVIIQVKHTLAKYLHLPQLKISSTWTEERRRHLVFPLHNSPAAFYWLESFKILLKTWPFSSQQTVVCMEWKYSFFCPFGGKKRLFFCVFSCQAQKRSL